MSLSFTVSFSRGFRMCLLQYYSGFCVSTGRNGRTTLILMQHLLPKLVHVLSWGLELAILGVKLFFHWPRQLSMKRQVHWVILLNLVVLLDCNLLWWHLSQSFIKYALFDSQQLLEVIKLEGISHAPEDAMMVRDVFLLQVNIPIQFLPNF